MDITFKQVWSLFRHQNKDELLPLSCSVVGIESRGQGNTTCAIRPCLPWKNEGVTHTLNKTPPYGSVPITPFSPLAHRSQGTGLMVK